MRLFVQAASPDVLRRAADAGLLDGVVLSPLDLAGEDPGADIRERLALLDSEFAVPVCVPVEAVSGNDIYREGRELARASDHVIVQVPFVEDAVPAIRRLVADGVRVGATYVFSGAQAFIAAKVGASIVTVHASDLEMHGLPGTLTVEEIRGVLDAAELECDLAITDIRSAVQFSGYVLAGVDTICVSAPVLDALALHSLTDRGVDRFLSALSRRPKPRGA